MNAFTEPTGWEIFEPAAKTSRPRISEIAEIVADHNNIPMKDLMDKRRERRISWPRQCVMHAAHNQGYTYQQIARFLGGRDHTTIVHGKKAHAERLRLGLVDQYGGEI